MVALIRRKWCPSELFSDLTPAMFAAEPSTLRERWNKLWVDLYTEYDARHLEKELSIRNLISTEEGAAFFNAWAADEERHTDGFIQIMELVADGSEKDLRERLNRRLHDFSAVNEYLRDEFSLIVVIAFDEMCTCHAYAADKEFYSGLGNNGFHRWLRELIADEAAHSTNAINVIRARYSDRVAEVGAILDGLTSGVADESGYGGTFILDHFGETYTKEMLANCRDKILRNVAKPLKIADSENYGQVDVNATG
ncbi:hypothetical protein [Bradyrhizobium sp. BWA-3-5]|uniref:hypothetical protein n=1 Tax=Bradyrhizobium sp. BWA-3-5 TaxID=3080013 RepID=UPI00293ED68B|nr:hypothetical protein [Bradyrhizobium sp. BWA-3-5]WOH64304.1 hypothetical protein RX331_27595 [Bradyrhizobium sp. BWA-3-5]